jgi:hypothetical protein
MKTTLFLFISVLILSFSNVNAQELSVKEIKALMKQIEKEYSVKTNYDNFDQKLWIHPVIPTELVNLDHEKIVIEVYFMYKPNEKIIGEKRIKFKFYGHSVDFSKLSFLIGKASETQTRHFLNLIEFQSSKSFYQGVTTEEFDILYTPEIEAIINDIVNRENVTPISIKVEGDKSYSVVSGWKKWFVNMIKPVDNAYNFLKNR